MGRTNGLEGLKTGKFLSTVEESVRKQADFFCVICTEPFKDTEDVVALRCNEQHVFHNHCIESWFKRATSCPTCRSENI